MTVHGGLRHQYRDLWHERLPQDSYTIAPHIGISQYRPKLALNLSYDGGLGIYQQLPNSNTYSQTGTADILYQFSSRWQGHVNDRYSYSADPFGSYFTIIGQPTPDNPNPNVFVPFATTQQNFGRAGPVLSVDPVRHADLHRQRSRFADIAITRRTLPSRAGLYNLISYSGGANYSHRFSAQLSLGGGYNWTSLDFSHGQQRSGIRPFRVL